MECYIHKGMLFLSMDEYNTRITCSSSMRNWHVSIEPGYIDCVTVLCLCWFQCSPQIVFSYFLGYWWHMALFTPICPCELMFAIVDVTHSILLSEQIWFSVSHCTSPDISVGWDLGVTRNHRTIFPTCQWITAQCYWGTCFWACR